MGALEFTVADVRITPRAFPFLSVIFIILLVLVLVFVRPLIITAGDLIESALPFESTTGYQVLINDMQSNYGVNQWSIISSEKSPFTENEDIKGTMIASDLSIAWCVVIQGQYDVNSNPYTYHYVVARKGGSWTAYQVESLYGAIAFETLGCNNY